jgi:hydrogenase nickel incorporation protein HypA/HybF
MHEYSLVRALLRQVYQVVAEHPGSHVVSVRVRIGEFSGVEPDLLSSAYDDLVQETPLQDAALNMVRVPLEGLCDQCGNQFRVERFNFQCDNCGGVQLTLCGGEEMLLDSVMMEEIEQ